jgi:hypothetical protein
MSSLVRAFLVSEQNLGIACVTSATPPETQIIFPKEVDHLKKRQKNKTSSILSTHILYIFHTYSIHRIDTLSEMNHPHPQRARNTSANEAEAHAKAVVDRVRKMTKPELVAYFASLDKEALDTLWARSGLSGDIVDPSARHNELANFAIMYRRAHLRKWAAEVAEAMLYAAGGGIALGTAFAHRNRHVPPSVGTCESVAWVCGSMALERGLGNKESSGHVGRLNCVQTIDAEEGCGTGNTASGNPNDMRNGGVFGMAALMAALALHNESVQWRAFRTRYKHTVKALATAFSEKSSGAATTKKKKKNKTPETKKTATHTRKSSSS